MGYEMEILTAVCYDRKSYGKLLRINFICFHTSVYMLTYDKLSFIYLANV